MRTWSSLLWLVVLAAGCDTSGIHPLGRLRDPLVPCDTDMLGRVETTSTWLRSTETGTEIILLGRPVATDVVENDEAACFFHGIIAHDSSTRFESGSYTLDEEGAGTAVRSIENVYVHQPERSILQRDGSIGTELPSPISQSLAIRQDGSGIVVTLGGERMRMRSLAELAETLDVTTQAGAEDLYRLYNLPLLTSQARLLGFGSGAMTQYIGANAEFKGSIRNLFTVHVESVFSPNTVISYFQFEELTGIVIDGEQHSNVDIGGNGKMSGVLSFVMRGSGGLTDVAQRGKIDYAGLIIRNGLAAGGNYVVTVDGAPAPFTVSYELQTNMDLRRILPIE